MELDKLLRHCEQQRLEGNTHNTFYANCRPFQELLRINGIKPRVKLTNPSKVIENIQKHIVQIIDNDFIIKQSVFSSAVNTAPITVKNIIDYDLKIELEL